MASTSSDQALKRIRELLPDNGKDIPDEFIIKILDACDQDLNRSFEELQDRLARASWESVEKAKKKKADKVQSGNGHPSNDRRRGPANPRFDGPRAGNGFPAGPGNSRFDGPRTGNGFSGGKENYNGPSSYRGRNGAVDNRGPARAVAKPATQEAAPQNRAPAPAVVEAAAVESKSIERAPAPPCTNQWAKGRPQVVPEVPKWVEQCPSNMHNAGAVTSKPIIEDLPSSPEIEDSRPLHDANVETGSLESSQTEDTVPEGHAPPVSDAVDYSKNSSPLEVLDNQAVERESSEARSTIEDSSGGPVTSVESATSEMTALQIGYSASPQDAAPHTHVHTSEQIPNSAAAPAGPEQLPAAQGTIAQDSYSSQASYPQYSAYQQQYHAAQQQQYAAAQDPSAFNVSRMYYNGANDMLGQSVLGMDGGANRAGVSNYAPKVPAQKQQPQQQQQQQQGLGWQNPMMNSYGMMNMYMSPQQMQMMYNMQTYGMGVYGPSAMNSQMYNSGNGYAAHQAFAGSKGQFNQPAAHNKKPGAFGGAFGGGQGFAGPSYLQSGGRSEDPYKFQRAQGTQGSESFESSYPYSYPGMSLPFDGGMSTQQGYPNVGRCGNSSNGGVGDESQYRSQFFGQADASQGQWIGGN